MHGLLTLLLVLVQSAQGIILDTFLITASPHSLGPYFWLISDLLVMFFFGISMCRSYTFWKKSTGQNRRVKSNSKIAEKMRRPSFFMKHKSLLGHHPLSYMTWFAYSLLLVIKISLIFKSEIINRVNPDSFLGPQLMKVCLGMTAIVFFLFVEGHHDAARDSQRFFYIANLIKGTSFEIFDSITFLSLLFVSETHMIYSFNFENVIIAFSCINLLLPNFCLYKLSLNDYGSVSTNALLSFTYKILHLLFVNVPYMVVRIYLWVLMDSDVSVFLVKNILHIILTLLDCKPEWKQIKASLTALPPSTSSFNNTNQTTLNETSCKITIAEENSFVEIDLKGQSSSQRRGENDIKPSPV